jgi:hypothetical protein
MTLAKSGIPSQGLSVKDIEGIHDSTVEEDLDYCPMIVDVVAPGRRVSAWEKKLIPDLHKAEESAASCLEGAESRCTPNDVATKSAWDAGESPMGGSSKAQLPHFVFSVKNTFLDVAQASDDEASDKEEPPPLPPLPPALSIIPTSVSPEKLAAYRADYARFRYGFANGAKGEVCTTTVT